MARKTSPNSPFLRFAFLVYSCTMLWLLFGRSHSWNTGIDYTELLRQNTNLTPLLTIKSYWYVLRTTDNPYMFWHCLVNLVGNVVLFIPAGWLLPRIWKSMRNFFRFLATCGGTMFFIEVIQLCSLLGRFDVDDLILNLSGLIFGFLFYHLIQLRQ